MPGKVPNLDLDPSVRVDPTFECAVGLMVDGISTTPKRMSSSARGGREGIFKAGEGTSRKPMEAAVVDPETMPQAETHADSINGLHEAIDCAYESLHPHIAQRKGSLCAEALVQEAARVVHDKTEKYTAQANTGRCDDGRSLEHSSLNTGSQDGREANRVRRHPQYRSTSSEDTGSSPNEHDDDVFSDRSAQSSPCSLDAKYEVTDSCDKTATGSPQQQDELLNSSLHRESFTSSPKESTRRTSGYSGISDLHAMTSSPTPSISNGSSPLPLSNKKRRTNGLAARITSPVAPVQYSPKGKSTPPRFRSRKEAPLVLLHVTLLPLRWVWGDVVNNMDAIVTAHNARLKERVMANLEAEGKPMIGKLEPSDGLKTLRDVWRELQDRVGDTVLERGILIPHPQNDYEILEERLLEALELPVKRRARILECGHYLGPSNVDDDSEDDPDFDDYDDDYSRREKHGKRHWCSLCRSEIKFEELGPNKAFRIKVYASNGLMKAGAWEACWKEMERVDVEIEPLVDIPMQNELEKLAMAQFELEDHHRREEEVALGIGFEQHARDANESFHLRSDTPVMNIRGQSAAGQLSSGEAMPTPSPVSVLPAAEELAALRTKTPMIDISGGYRHHDEELLHEIHGETDLVAPRNEAFNPYQQPQQRAQSRSQASSAAMVDSTVCRPRSQHADVHQSDPYRQPQPPRQRPHSSRKMFVLDENTSFVDLLMEAFKVLLRDPKNVAIIVLSLFLVVLVKQPRRPGSGLEVVMPGRAPQVIQEPMTSVQSQQQPQQPQVQPVPQVLDGPGAQMSQLPQEQSQAMALQVQPQGLEPIVASSIVAESPFDPRVGSASDLSQSPKKERMQIEGTPFSQLSQKVQAAELETNGRARDAKTVALASSNSVIDPLVCHWLEHPQCLKISPFDDCISSPINALNLYDDHCFDSEPTLTISVSSTDPSVFVSGPMVTACKTVRIYETVTETVRVSVITQT
ncbi:uncharacterized protein CTHT_0015590 [Thermochaetoides thermophila DSM 1495]|uniref:Uncharacterized protein n=1 Tax=Chaetomium thermophilum (strain DSM 1495 / CBS 144.50 / IMI 039719) TaxID=759272 RepID=G0S213_CHATD|nr:hypothetical protein CTHT_0015590 [Thermochaetoides thermophila DSM 1495]EGS23073.1 hypothetical protein CTHT_0015590 [Thermochaetoides thermophila DSM 1495]